VFTKGGKAELVFTPEDGSEPTRQLIHQIKDTDEGGCVLGYFNIGTSIRSFAKACFDISLLKRYELKLSTSNTIFKKYDGLFVSIFEDEYVNNYKDRFDRAGITYEHRLIDDLVA